MNAQDIGNQNQESEALILRTTTIPAEQMTALLSSLDVSDPVFLDIETTGLGWRSSHLYLIGLLYQEGGSWSCRQCFLKRPFAEEAVLQELSVFLSLHPDATLVHYNGDTFDLPYLRQKYAYYQLPVPHALIERHGIDLLRRIRPLRHFLSFPSLRLQEVARFLGHTREDHSSGGALIEDYQTYLQTNSEELRERLFLHNKEDVLHLPALLPLLTYDTLRTMLPKGIHTKVHDHVFCIGFTLPHPIPDPIRREVEGLSLSITEDTVTLRVPIEQGIRKQFFSPYRDYYYLPAEDTAIHKSVAQFVDPAHRKKATAATCYQRVEGLFLPAYGKVDRTLFYENDRATQAWFRWDDLDPEDPVVLTAYTRGILDQFF